MEQKYTSKDTCVKTINKIYSQMEYSPESLILDYGGGKYDVNAEYMQKKNKSRVLVYDKYNRAPEHNKAVLDYCKKHTPDYIVCSNVLNVIEEDDIINNILLDISKYKGSTVLISVYERNKSGVGEVTKKGYQRNQPKEWYREQISKYFTNIKLNKGIFVCKN